MLLIFPKQLIGTNNAYLFSTPGLKGIKYFRGSHWYDSRDNERYIPKGRVQHIYHYGRAVFIEVDDQWYYSAVAGCNQTDLREWWEDRKSRYIKTNPVTVQESLPLPRLYSFRPVAASRKR